MQTIFSVEKSIDVLRNTPQAITALLQGLDDELITKNEGENTWSAKEVVAHLVVCEETNWIPRAKIILAQKQDEPFIPIDMHIHLEYAQKTNINELLKSFMNFRQNSVEQIESFGITPNDLEKTAFHPKLGAVKLSQLLATWVTHDLTHIAQIARVIAKQNKPFVGPFEIYLSVLK
jgi:uncharacterized damage-inducible protein DinB